MSAQIDVSSAGPGAWRVDVTEGGSTTTHIVIATDDHIAELGGGADAATLLRESFRFLLEREPKESILSRFELPVIGRYFPDYPDEMRQRLSG